MAGQDYVPIFRHGPVVTCIAGAAISAQQLVQISAGTLLLGGADNQFEVSPPSTGVITPTVIPTTAATPAQCGVAAQTVPSGSPVTVYFGGVHTLSTAGSITAEESVIAAAGGGVAAYVSGTNDASQIVGKAWSANESGFVAVHLFD